MNDISNEKFNAVEQLEKPSRFGPDLRKFGNWALVWIILANLPFMAMWFVGAPPRHLEIVLAGFIGLFVKRTSPIIQWLCFAGIMTFSVLSFISGMFNLHLSSLIYSLQFLAKIKPSSSLEYIVAAAMIAVILAASWFLLKRDTNFTKPSYILLGGVLISGLMSADIAVGKNMRGHYFRDAPAGAYFESAVQKTDFLARADGERHLILIVVESLGVPKDNQAIKDKLFAYYENPAAKARYDMAQGSTLYYNSTTSGEVRELCGRWGDYYALLEAAEANCLPILLAKKGYASNAMHNFNAEFFKRGIWYPNAGFGKLEFWDDLKKRGAEWCGGVFDGACDRNVPKLLAENLKMADGPTFQYWLTLNAHLPVLTGMNLKVEDCAKVSRELDTEFPMICRQFAIFDDIDRALIKEITASDFPEADILIVGDHMPPYFDRHNRSQFDPERVPYLYLKAKPRQDTARPAK